jgi:hypothetical protein
MRFKCVVKITKEQANIMSRRLLQWLIFLLLLFYRVGCDWVHLVRQPLVCPLYQPRTTDEYGAFDGMRIGRGNRRTRRDPDPSATSSTQILHDLTWDRSRADGGGKPATNRLSYGTASFTIVTFNTFVPGEFANRFSQSATESQVRL